MSAVNLKVTDNDLHQRFLTFSTPGTPIPKDTGIGTLRLRDLQRRCIMKEQTLLWWDGWVVDYWNDN